MFVNCRRCRESKNFSTTPTLRTGGGDDDDDDEGVASQKFAVLPPVNRDGSSITNQREQKNHTIHHVDGVPAYFTKR